MVLVRPNTPWQTVEVSDRRIYVKREDLCCPDGPRFSKMRGVERFLEKAKGRPIGVLDTVHSKGGWGVAWMCHHMGLECINFYPTYKGEEELRYNQLQSQALGAKMVSLKAGRSAILFHQAKARLSRMTHGAGLMVPNGLQLEESIHATAEEVENYTPPEYLGGTWVVSASTGTLAAGVAFGLRGRARLVVHMGYSHSQERLVEKLGWPVAVIDEGYAYKDSVDYPCPFPCNPYYDLKAWRWLTRNLDALVDPVVFWNIGE